MPTILLCPGCHRNIKTIKMTTELPAKITCPGCSHVAESSKFVTYEPPSRPEPSQADYSADAAPITIPEASPTPIKPPRQPGQLDILFDIGHTRTKSYAQLLWIASIVSALMLDCYLVLFTIARASIVGFLGIVAVHLLLLPVVRIMLECAVNIERIAKR